MRGIPQTKGASAAPIVRASVMRRAERFYGPTTSMIYDCGSARPLTDTEAASRTSVASGRWASGHGK